MIDAGVFCSSKPSHKPWSDLLLLDLIIVLDRGEVAEQGTHDELLRQRGLYYEMWIQQADVAASEEEHGSGAPQKPPMDIP